MAEPTVTELFISHLSSDRSFVQALCQRLEEYGIRVEVSIQGLVAGFFLHRTTRSAIATANCFVVVQGTDTRNSRQIHHEIALARRVAQSRNRPFQPIVLRLSGTTAEPLEFGLEDSPQLLSTEDDPETLDNVLPELIAALSRCLPESSYLIAPGGSTALRYEGPAALVGELILTLRNPTLTQADGRERLYAEATLDYFPAGHLPTVDVREHSDHPDHHFRFTVPLDPIEAMELCWYLGDYRRWPIGEFQRRAQALEATLPRWGQALYRAALGSEVARTARDAWRRAAGERRFSVRVDTTVLPSTVPTKAATTTPTTQESVMVSTGSFGMVGGRFGSASTVVTALLALPWELLHDGQNYLFQGASTVRRYHPQHGREERAPAAIEPPVRVLLVSPRPEDENTPYLNHRQNAQPLVRTLAALGGLAQLTLLTPPTLGELEKALGKARHRRAPYTVVHLDGYGIYDRHHGRGVMSFEDPASLERLEGRPSTFIEADDLATMLHEQRVSVVFLTVGSNTHHKGESVAPPEKRPGCTASDDTAVTTALAARLLRAGVPSVVAIGHHVPSSTTSLFLETFYNALVRGEHVGTATAKGRQALRDNPYRMEVMGTQVRNLSHPPSTLINTEDATESVEVRTTGLVLFDWFVPMLYQGTQDLQPFRRLPEARLITLQAEQRPLFLGALPPPPPQGFHGRSRELLALERRFLIASYAVITGPTEIGKTALAVETARWLVENGRFERTAFVSLEDHPHPRAVLDCLDRQLVANGSHDGSVATDPQIQQRVERALADRPTLIVLDNALMRLATTLPEKLAGIEGTSLTATSSLQAILDLCRVLQRAALTTRLLFTSHEPLPPPYTGHTHSLGPLDEGDAIALVAGVLRATGQVPAPTDPGRTRTELLNLVQIVERHPQALVLIAPDLVEHGVRATTGKLRTILAELHRIHPDPVPVVAVPTATFNPARTPLLTRGGAGIVKIEQVRALYAAIALSLGRLSPEVQKQARVLAHFQGVASLNVVAEMLSLSSEKATTFGEQLIHVGLAHDLGNNCLALDSVLPAYLTAATDEHIRTADWEHWLKAMAGRLDALYKEWFRNADLCLQLTRRELPNFLALLDWTASHRAAEETLGFVWRLETLLASLHLPRALERVTALRERLAPHLTGWGRAAFSAEAAAVERLLEAGWLPEALEQAQALLGRTESAGERAYPGAAYDMGIAYRLVSRALEASGNAGAALAHLEVARRRFQALATAGSETATRMISVCYTERGDCLRALGQLEAAATAYQEALTVDEIRGATRDAAVNRLQLADVWRLQGAYPEALALYAEARESFTELREPAMVAVAWHQMGLIHQEIGDGEAAETAYQEVLGIWVRRGDLDGEALTLIELGDLYTTLNRREQATSCYRQAADRYGTLGDAFHEGQARRHLADTLLDLGDATAARQEVERALVCQSSFGHTAEPWKTWTLLADIERTQNRQEATVRAQNEAVATYLAYRREGGEPSFPGGRLCEQVAVVLNQGNGAAELLEGLRTATLEPNLRAELNALLPRLEAIIAGSCDSALADDPTLHYSDTAELRLLLERTSKVSNTLFDTYTNYT
ncbi:putative Tetratricopeptide repeat protein [Gammaproteobacteria bacterium]